MQNIIIDKGRSKNRAKYIQINSCVNTVNQRRQRRHFSSQRDAAASVHSAILGSLRDFPILNIKSQKYGDGQSIAKWRWQFSTTPAAVAPPRRRRRSSGFPLAAIKTSRSCWPGPLPGYAYKSQEMPERCHALYISSGSERLAPRKNVSRKMYHQLFNTLHTRK